MLRANERFTGEGRNGERLQSFRCIAASELLAFS